MVSLDLYLAYLRAAFHTCYYCSVTTDHVEELQRKCIKHIRKPLLESPLADQLKPMDTSNGDKDLVKEEPKDDNAEKQVLEKKDNKATIDKKEGRNGAHTVDLVVDRVLTATDF